MRSKLLATIAVLATVVLVGPTTVDAHQRRRARSPRTVTVTRTVMETPLQDGGLQGEGVGMYTDPSTAMQLSTFSINKRIVSCGVGTLAATGLTTGPFAMLMYSTRIASYNIDQATNTIRAEGRMRSITQPGSIAPLGSPMNEDVEHDFVALAKGGQQESFNVHFKTPFWNTSNPMCSPSDVISGGCRFGGILSLGDIAS